MPASHSAVEVFCSYAHEDDVYRKQLETHVSALKREGLIMLWHDRQILPGANWAKIIDAHLETASIIVLLISADFINSDYCYGVEMKRALERHEANEARVIPILVRSCDWQNLSIAQLQALPEGAHPISEWASVDKAWTEVVAGLRLVIEDLSHLSASAPASTLPKIWMVPSARNPFFVGRDAIFQALQKDLVPGGTTTALTQAISGLGGIGKTQVAVEYAHRYASSYEAVLWLQADSWETLTSACLKLATEVLGLPEQQEAQRQVEAVKRWLQNHRGWLLILDNVEKPEEMLTAFIPSKHQGSVLITTRMRHVGPLARAEMLPLFSEDEGVLFLLRRAEMLAPHETIKDAPEASIVLAKKLCELMDRLPLALDQAGAYIAENGCSLQRYIDLYQQARPKLLDRRETIDHPDSVLMTFWLSWEQIQERNPLAGKVLQFCAYLSPDQIPEELVLEGIADSETEGTNDALEMEEALGLLYRYSLVERAEQTLSLHRLVQEVTQDVLSQEERQQWMERAVLVVNAFFPSGEYGTWPECEFLLPHALTCAKWTGVLGILEGARLLSVTGRYLYERAQYREAEPLCLRALAIYEEQLGATHPDTAACLNNLGELYRAQGRYSEAEPLYRRALTIFEEQLGATHLETGISLNNLAAFYESQDRYSEAETLYRRVLTIREEQLGGAHPDTATTLNNLGELYRAQGRYSEAEALCQRALTICEEQLGAAHPSTATTLNNLAAFYNSQGKYSEAESLYRRALTICEEQLGAAHPSTAATVNNLAGLYESQGRYAEAEGLYKRAANVYRASLSMEHPQTQQIWGNYLMLLSRMYTNGDMEALLQLLAQGEQDGNAGGEVSQE